MNPNSFGFTVLDYADRLEGSGNGQTLVYTIGFGQPISVTDALNQTITFDYDSVGNLIATTDPLGNRTLRFYDAAVPSARPAGVSVKKRVVVATDLMITK